MATAFIAVGNLQPGEVASWVWGNAVLGGNYTFITYPRPAPRDVPHPVQVKTEIVNVAEVAPPGGPLVFEIGFTITNTGGFCRYSVFMSFDPPL